MKTKQVTLYNIGELKENFPEVYKKTIDRYNDINTDFDWYEFTIQDYTDQLEKIGFHSVKIEFSGFSSQGDGACFTGGYNMPSILKRKQAEIPCIENLRILLEKIGINHEFFFNIVKGYNSRYSHENSVRYGEGKFFHVTGQYYENIPEKFESIIFSACQNIMQEIYSTLEIEYEYLTSELAIFETLEVNEYYFNLEGKIASTL